MKKSALKSNDNLLVILMHRLEMLQRIRRELQEIHNDINETVRVIDRNSRATRGTREVRLFPDSTPMGTSRLEDYQDNHKGTD